MKGIVSGMEKIQGRIKLDGVELSILLGNFDIESLRVQFPVAIGVTTRAKHSYHGALCAFEKVN